MMARQTNLFGFVVENNILKKIYKNPKTKYEHFVNKYVSSHDGSNQTLVNEANLLWRDGNKQATFEVTDKTSVSASAKQHFISFITPKTDTEKDKAGDELPTLNKKIHIEESNINNDETEIETLSGTKDKQLSIIRYFIQDIGIPPEFLSEDVLSHKEYMSILEQVSATYKTFKMLKSEYQSHSVFTKSQSELQVNLNDIEQMIKVTVTWLSEIASINTGSNSLIEKLQSCQMKMNKITQSIPELFCLKNKMEYVISSLQGAIRAKKARNFKKLTMTDNFKISCENSCTFTWEFAMENIQRLSENSRLIFAPMSVQSMCQFPEFCQTWHSLGNNFIPHQAIVDHFSELKLENYVPAMVKQLSLYFPLLCIQSGSQFILIDIHEMIWTPELIYEILTLDISMKFKNPTDSNEENEIDEQVNEGVFFYSKSGPKPLEEKHPELIEELVDFCKLHGFAAHARRRNGTVSACGVRIEDIRQHLLKTVDGLQSISKSKVYNLLQPRRSNTKEASNHKNAVDVSVGKKNTDISNDHPDVHAYFSSVKYVRELGAKYSEHFSVWSCDGKAKVHIGGQAVSRYHQLRTFFPNDDSPHYKDHDFPVPGYLIEPDGYLLLKNKEIDVANIQDQSYSTDKLGRKIHKYPATGPLWVFNRAVKHQSASVSDHISDVRNILKWNPDLRKPIQVFITDGGPDWTPKSSLTAFFLGRFWKEENLDMVISCTNAPGWSRFNPIEHLWSPLSKFLAGVSLSASLPGERKPPVYQTDLSEDDRKQKEYKVLDSAVKDLNSYWNERTHDDFNICSVGVGCDGSLLSSHAEWNYTSYNQDYEKVKEMFSCSLKKIKADRTLNNLLLEWQYYIKHMDKRTGMLVLKKQSCGDNDCLCRGTPVIAENVFQAIPKSEKWLLPPVTRDVMNDGHYLTLTQLHEAPIDNISDPDELLEVAKFGHCENQCRYVFTSVADGDKHKMFIHGSKAQKKPQAPRQNTCGVCNEVFPTRYQLLKHQKLLNHKLGLGRPKKT